MTKLFNALRQDPDKIESGVWITHPETGDQLRVRPMLCAEHAKAYLELLQEFKDENGEDAKPTDEQEREMDAKATATGLICDWKLAEQPDLEYDAALMAAALLDPELVEFQTWFRIAANDKGMFRPEAVGKD
jgi:hypothetical protein